MGDDDDDNKDGGGGGDGEEGEKKGGDDEMKKSWFDKLNPFGKKKDKDKDKDKEKDDGKPSKEQQKKDAAEEKRKKEESALRKEEREQNEESARQAARREKYQRLLQKAPDTKRRVFQFRMKAIKFQSLSSEPLTGLYLKVTLGGDYSEREEPGKGLVKSGKKGQLFKTGKSPKLRENDVHYYPNAFGAGIPVYWLGSYVDLEMEELTFELWQGATLKKEKKRAEHAIPLHTVANGSVMTEIVLRDAKKAGEKSAPPLLRVTYVCFFEELFVFQLRFVNWRGIGLRASDAPKKKNRAEVEEITQRRKAAAREAKAKAKEDKVRKAKEERARRVKEKEDAIRRAQSGGLYKGGEDNTGSGGTSSTSDTGPAADGTGGGAEADDVPLISSTDDAAGSAGSEASGGSRKRKGWLLGGRKGGKKAPKRSYEERVALQKDKDKEKKQKRDEKNLERLRRLKKEQEEREEKRQAKHKKEEEAKQFDKELFTDATSDPYIVFSIDPPTVPGCKIIRNGGYFGRSVRTDMNLNTLNPFFEEARKPLAYLGTRSELENEMLRIRVYDWDFFTPDDLIGMADVPLNGLLEYGQVEAELTYDRLDTSSKKVRGKYPTITEPAGKVLGQIVFEGQTPDYSQVGLIIERKPGITYLAVKLNSANKLSAADANGSSDPFVVVDWDGAQQSSKVVYRSLEPVWNQTLYFPLKLVTITKETLQKKPPVSIRVFDLDYAGHDLLGSCEVPLHLVTAAPHAKVETEKGADGRVHKGRVFKDSSLKLILPGFNVHSTINLQLYFAPDLPLDIVLEETAARKNKELEEVYATRLKTFWKSLPPRVQGSLTDNMLREFDKEGSDYEVSPRELRRLVSAEDQDEIEHFLCEYLNPQQPPADMKTEMEVARMVRCVTWAADTEVFKKEFKTDVWQSPPFFLEMRKGDYEDHALLFCNLLLGLTNENNEPLVDAYVCVGRLKDTGEKDKRHVWVMTREGDGSVKMWETSTGMSQTLPRRWSPKASADETESLLAGRGGRAKVDKSEGGKKGKKGKKGNKKGGGAEGGDEEGGRGDDGAGVLALKSQEEEEEDTSPMNADMMLLGGEEIMREEHNDDELLTKIDIEELMSEVIFFDPDDNIFDPGDDDDDGGAEHAEEMKAIRQKAKEAEKAAASQENADDPNMPFASLPYDCLECIFNDKNLWISRDDLLSKVLDPALLTYDLEDSSRWEAFADKRMTNEGLPKSFYTSRRLAPKVPADRLRNMEQQIMLEIKSQIQTIRLTTTTLINRSAELEKTLYRGLDLQERLRTGDTKVPGELGPWKRAIKGNLPPSSKFKGRAFNYAYTDAKKIRRHLLNTCDYAEEMEDGLEFAIAVRVFAFHGGICSVWVFFGSIDTNLLD